MRCAVLYSTKLHNETDRHAVARSSGIGPVRWRTCFFRRIHARGGHDQHGQCQARPDIALCLRSHLPAWRRIQIRQSFLPRMGSPASAVKSGRCRARLGRLTAARLRRLPPSERGVAASRRGEYSAHPPSHFSPLHEAEATLRGRGGAGLSSEHHPSEQLGNRTTGHLIWPKCGITFGWSDGTMPGWSDV